MDFNEIMSKVFNEAVEAEVAKRLGNKKTVDVDFNDTDELNRVTMELIEKCSNHGYLRDVLYTWFCNEYSEELKQDYFEINSFTRSDIPEEMVADIKEEAIDELDRDDFLKILNDRYEAEDFVYFARNLDYYDMDDVKELVKYLIERYL